MDTSLSSAPAKSLELAAELTAAWLGNPNTRASAEEVPAFLRRMHESVSRLMGAGQGTPEPVQAPEEHKPAVSVRKSLSSPDHILSMIDGKPYRSLRRHLGTHGLTPDQYRERYGLKPDYPMVAPSYSEQRRRVAKQFGLGRRHDGGAPDAADAADEPATGDKGQGGATPASRRKLKLRGPA